MPTRTIRDERQLPLVTMHKDYTQVRVADLPDFSRFKTLGFDTETHDVDLENGSKWPHVGVGELVGFALATAPEEGGGRWYLPVGHPEDNVDDPDQLRAKLRHELNRFDGTLVGLNLLYDLGWAWREGVTFPKSEFYDVGFAEALINEYAPGYSLKKISERYGVGAKDEQELREAAATFNVDPKRDLWKLPARFVHDYACQDAWLPLACRTAQEAEIKRQSLYRVMQLEHDLLPLLREMRVKGVRVDIDRCEHEQARFYVKRDEALEELRRLCGFRLTDPWDKAAGSTALKMVDIHVPRTATGQPQLQQPWLEAQDHPACTALVKARRYDKAGRDFFGSMLLGHAYRGRIHGEFHPLRQDDNGTVGGRLSATNPNLQQVPARDPEVGPAVRACLLPEEGAYWAAVDWSAQEPRTTLHYANLMGLRGAAEAVKVYHENPRTDYHQMVADFTGLRRKEAKTVNLAIPYGAGGAKIADQLGLPTEWITLKDRVTGRETEIRVAGPEAKAILQTYHQRFPYTRELVRTFTEAAETRGFVRTLGGRMCHFPFWEKKGRGGGFGPLLDHASAVARFGEDNVQRVQAYKATNRAIQGSAADMMKYALRELWRAGVVPHLTIHDENGFSVESKRQAVEYGEIMCHCFPLAVPLVVDVEVGPSWGEAQALLPGEEDTK